jgi:hypothetical protein
MNGIKNKMAGAMTACLFVAATAHGQPVTTYPLYNEGVQMTLSIDRTFNGTNWNGQQVQVVNPQTGQLVWVWRTYCNQFVIRACSDLGVALPNTSANGLADYFVSPNGRAAGWTEVTSADAQRLANRGWVVVSSWKNTTVPDASGTYHGHMQMVRASGTRDVAVVLVRGPEAAQAGVLTKRVTDATEGYGTAAWRNKPVRFFAFRLPTSR